MKKPSTYAEIDDQHVRLQFEEMAKLIENLDTELRLLKRIVIELPSMNKGRA